jgi:DNA-binding NarL/FixJ family response regulator
VRVVIADDSGLIREALTRALEQHGLTVCGTARDGRELLALARRERPDVAFVDIRMPPTLTDEGLVAAQALLDEDGSIGVIVLSQHLDAGYARRLLDGRPGRCGYLLKDRVADIDALVSAARRVKEGELVVDGDVIGALLRRRRSDEVFESLSDKEREVLELVAQGLTDGAIARRLWLSPRTVESHVRHILQKLSLPPNADDHRRVRAVIAYLDR